MFKAAVLAASVAVVAMAAPAAAATIVIDESVNNPDVPFYTTSQTFNLGAGFTNARLNVTSFGADDAAVIRINGTNIVGTGIFGPGDGNFFFTAGGPSTPFTFTRGNDTGAQSFTAPFVVGLNTLEIIVNNNNAGINTGNGGLTGGPSGVNLTGTVTFDAAAAVPEPAAWAMLIGGFGIAGVAARRRRATLRVTYG